MDIKIEIDSAGMHGPETATNLPAGVSCEFHINLKSAIREALIDKVKAKAIATGLQKDKTWKFGGGVKDGLAPDAGATFVGSHKIKIELNGEKLAKDIKLTILAPKKEVKPEAVGKVNSKALNKARNELESLAKQIPKLVTMKKGDSNHPTALRYSIKINGKDLSGTLYAGDDSHVKEHSAEASMTQWSKDKAALAQFLKDLKASKEA